ESRPGRDQRGPARGDRLRAQAVAAAPAARARRALCRRAGDRIAPAFMTNGFHREGHAPRVTVVGAGLARAECAYQLAQHGVRVRLLEQKPEARSAAHCNGNLAELVCSNSLRGAALANAVGLLKEEMRRSGSLIMACADQTRVPAGGALAVDRERFS